MTDTLTPTWLAPATPEGGCICGADWPCVRPYIPSDCPDPEDPRIRRQLKWMLRHFDAKHPCPDPKIDRS